MGLGALLGFAVGYTAKKALKIALILTGILVVLGVSLQNYGIITIHWPEIEGVYTRAVEQSGGLKAYLSQWAGRFETLIPVAGSFSIGFLFGLRRG